MAHIFISHSSRDNEPAARMKVWLESHGFENAFLDEDKLTGIPPGADWEKTLYREVERVKFSAAPKRRTLTRFNVDFQAWKSKRYKSRLTRHGAPNWAAFA